MIETKRPGPYVTRKKLAAGTPLREGDVFGGPDYPFEPIHPDLYGQPASDPEACSECYWRDEEWRMFCQKCGYTWPVNTAVSTTAHRKRCQCESTDIRIEVL